MYTASRLDESALHCLTGLGAASFLTFLVVEGFTPGRGTRHLTRHCHDPGVQLARGG